MDLKQNVRLLVLLYVFVVDGQFIGTNQVVKYRNGDTLKFSLYLDNVPEGLDKEGLRPTMYIDNKNMNSITEYFLKKYKANHYWIQYKDELDIDDNGTIFYSKLRTGTLYHEDTILTVLHESQYGDKHECLTECHIKKDKWQSQDIADHPRPVPATVRPQWPVHNVPLQAQTGNTRPPPATTARSPVHNVSHQVPTGSTRPPPATTVPPDATFTTQSTTQDTALKPAEVGVGWYAALGTSAVLLAALALLACCYRCRRSNLAQDTDGVQAENELYGVDYVVYAELYEQRHGRPPPVNRLQYSYVVGYLEAKA